MNAEMFTTLLLYMRANPTLSRGGLVAAMVDMGEHTTEQAEQWVDAVATALYESAVIDEGTFNALLQKAISLSDEQVSVFIGNLVKIVATWIKAHPLAYQIEVQISVKEAELESVRQEPDEVQEPNWNKISTITRLEAEIEFLRTLE